ncbi:MAG: DUF1850 domain-containing protein [Clostridia bacterium]|nr:DUF1850 domain-containing protein [Clostridia bacterium]
MASRPKKVVITITAAAVVLLAAVIVLLLAVPQYLLIRDADTGMIRGIRRCPPGYTFAVEFIHSVNLTPVIDTFHAEDGYIQADSSLFYSYGAGMPTELNPGERFSFTEDGGMLISGMSYTYDKLSYIVGTVYDHYLIFPDTGERINLRELCGRNARVELILFGGR